MKKEALETSDYEKFKFLKTNAEIDQRHVKRLIASISIKNMLKLRPILVNTDLEVIDGQHRLLAAKALRVPIFYQIDEEAGDEEMILLNTASRTWTITEYVHHYAQKGNDNFIRIDRICKLYSVSPSFVIKVCGTGSSKRAGVKAGTFQFSKEKEVAMKYELEKAFEVMEFIRSQSLSNVGFLKTEKALMGIMQLQKKEGFDNELFMKKLISHIEKVHCCIDANGFLEMFKNIYNWKNQNPID